MRTLLLIAALGLGGCAISPAPLYGGLYTNITYPSQYGTSQLGPGSKRGTSSATSFLGIIATGDAGVEAASNNGGITTIHTVDQTTTNVLGLFATYKTTVTGE